MIRRRNFGDAIRRDEIISAAISLVAEGGLAGTTLARIAETAGISNAAVLYYFRSKAEVIEAAYATVIEAVGKDVRDAMEAAPSGRAAIDAYVRSLIGHMVDHPKHLRLVIELAIAHASRTVALPGAPPRWAPLATAIERGIEEGDLVALDSRTAAIALGGAIDAIFSESMSDSDYNLEQGTDELLRIFHRASDSSLQRVDVDSRRTGASLPPQVKDGR